MKSAWTVIFSDSEEVDHLYQVEAHTEDGAINRAGNIYQGEQGRFPNDSQIVSVIRTLDPAASEACTAGEQSTGGRTWIA